MKRYLFSVLLALLIQPTGSWAIYDPYSTPASQQTQQQVEELQRQLQHAEFERYLEKIQRERAASEAEEQALAEAEQARNEALRASIRTRNYIYSGVLFFSVLGFASILISKKNRKVHMDENEKYGVVTIVTSILLMLLSLMISEGWSPQMDFIENLMFNLEVNLFTYEPSDHVYEEYLIDIPTKYVELFF